MEWDPLAVSETIDFSLDAASSWASLPAEVLMLVFSFLDESSLRSAMVCFHWSSCARSEHLWAQLLRNHWPDCRRLGKVTQRSFFDLCGLRPAIDQAWDRNEFVVDLAIAKQSKGIIDFIELAASSELITCGLQKDIFVSNLVTREQQVLSGHEHFVCDLAQLSDGLFASCSYDSTIMLWNSQREWVRTSVLAGHRGPVLESKPYRRGNLLSRGRDGTVRLWNVDKGSCVQVLRGHTAAVTSLKILEDGNRILTSGRDGCLSVWDVRTGSVPIQSFQRLHSADIYSINVPMDNVVISCSADSSIKAVHVSEGREMQTWNTPEVPYVVRSDPPGGLSGIFAGGGNGSLMRVDFGDPIAKVMHGGHEGRVALNSLRLINGCVVSGSLDASLCIWKENSDTRLMEAAVKLPHHHSEVIRQIKANHFRILSCGYDGTVNRIRFDNKRDSNDDKDTGCCLQ